MAMRTDWYGLCKLIIGLELVNLGLSHALIAQAAPPPASKPLVSTEKTIVLSTKAFDLKQLASPKTPQEFLKLLRLISEKFLLMDSEFQKDEFLLALFGPGEISDPYETSPKIEGIKNKRIGFKNNALFAQYFKMTYIGFGFYEHRDQVPIKASGSMGFMISASKNPFSANLIESILTSNAQLHDPLGGVTAADTQETRESAIRRPFKTHSKGYFIINEIYENERYISKLQIQLDINGFMYTVGINQEEKQ